MAGERHESQRTRGPMRATRRQPRSGQTRPAWPGNAMRVEKHKWDGRVSSDGAARLVAAPRDAVAWYVAAGSERRLPSKSTSEQRHQSRAVGRRARRVVGALCPGRRGDGDVAAYVLHAAAPFEPPTADVISWIDLDLDFEVTDGVVALEDEAQFHAHASRCRTRTTSCGVPGQGSPRSPPATRPESGRSTAGWRSTSPPRWLPKVVRRILNVRC